MKMQVRITKADACVMAYALVERRACPLERVSLRNAVLVEHARLDGVTYGRGRIFPSFRALSLHTFSPHAHFAFVQLLIAPNDYGLVFLAAPPDLLSNTRVPVSRLTAGPCGGLQKRAMTRLTSFSDWCTGPSVSRSPCYP